MAWFSGVLQDVKLRGSGFRDRVRDASKALAGRSNGTSGYDKGTASSFLSAQEAESRIETEASRLGQCQGGSEILERWLSLLRSNSRRYVDDGEDGPKRELSFKQVFLRSRALELCLDTAARQPELRQALRSYALAAPARWPESCPPPMAFARAFVALLWATVGPTESWLPLLGTLLSSEQVPSAGNEAEEPCHTWLVQLIAGRRTSWQVSDVFERESDLVAQEEKAQQALEEALDDSPRRPGEGLKLSFDHGSEEEALRSELRRMTKFSSAIASAQELLERRGSLNDDLLKASTSEMERCELFAGTVASVASAATALAASLTTDSVNADGLTEKRAELCAKSSELKEKLTVLTPELTAVQDELDAAEEAHRELMRQLKQNKEHLDTLRKKRDEGRKQEEQLRSSLLRTEQRLANQLAAEDAVRHRTEASQALAYAVADVAANLKAESLEAVKVVEDASEGPQARLAATRRRNAHRGAELTVELARREVVRSRLAFEIGEWAIKMAEDAQPRSDPTDLDEDAKETFVRPQLQAPRLALLELRLALVAEAAAKRVEDLGDDCPEAGGGASDEERAQLASEIRQNVQRCRDVKERLEVFVKPMEEKDAWEVVDEQQSTPAGEAFLFGDRPEPASSWDASGLKSLFNGLAARAVGTGVAPPSSTADSDMPTDDPFLLEGVDAAQQLSDLQQQAPASVEAPEEDFEDLSAALPETTPSSDGADKAFSSPAEVSPTQPAVTVPAVGGEVCEVGSEEDDA